MSRLPFALLLGIALVAGPPTWTAEPTPARVVLTGVPARVTSGQALTVRLGLTDVAGPETEVEVSIVLADRAAERTVWQVPLEEGRGERDISLRLPETRVRLPLRLEAVLIPQRTEARTDCILLPEWRPGRLSDVLRGKDIAVMDSGDLIAPALGTLTFQPMAAADPLAVERFTGDLIICHLPQFSPTWEGVVVALLHQLRQGRSVIWLLPEGEEMPPVLHSGLLLPARWPFLLRPGWELKHTPAEDLLGWARTDESLPFPSVASFGAASLVVCSDRVLTQLADEPAAGWLWEDLLLWGVKDRAEPSKVARLTFDSPSPYQYELTSVPTFSAGVLILSSPDWVQPSEQRLRWLREVKKVVEQGNALVVTGAESDRGPALRALGIPSVDFIPVAEPADLMLGPSLLLWGLARTDPHYRLVTKQRESSLLDAYVGSRTGRELFTEFRIGEGLLLLCQPNFDESQIGLDEHLLDHLATQLLTPPGQSLLVGESVP
jgi:hypothetical protein